MSGLSWGRCDLDFERPTLLGRRLGPRHHSLEVLGSSLVAYSLDGQKGRDWNRLKGTYDLPAVHLTRHVAPQRELLGSFARHQPLQTIDALVVERLRWFPLPPLPRRLNEMYRQKIAAIERVCIQLCPGSGSGGSGKKGKG